MKIISKITFTLLVLTPMYNYGMHQSPKASSELKDIKNFAEEVFSNCVIFLAQQEFYNRPNNPELPANKLLAFKDEIKKISILRAKLNPNDIVHCLKHIPNLLLTIQKNPSNKEKINFLYTTILNSWQTIEPLVLAYNDILNKCNIVLIKPLDYSAFKDYAFSVTNLNVLAKQTEEIFKETIYLHRKVRAIISTMDITDSCIKFPEIITSLRVIKENLRNLDHINILYNSIQHNMNGFDRISLNDISLLIELSLKINAFHDELYACWQNNFILRNAVKLIVDKLNISIDTNINDAVYRDIAAEKAYQECVSISKRIQLLKNATFSTKHNAEVATVICTTIGEKIHKELLMHYTHYVGSIHAILTKGINPTRQIHVTMQATQFTIDWNSYKKFISLESIVSYLENDAKN